MEKIKILYDYWDGAADCLAIDDELIARGEKIDEEKNKIFLTGAELRCYTQDPSDTRSLSLSGIRWRGKIYLLLSEIPDGVTDGEAIALLYIADEFQSTRP